MQIRFYPDGANGPVKEYLDSLKEESQTKKAWAKLMRDLALLASEGTKCRAIDVKTVKGIPGSVWELRRIYDNIKYRIYFCVKKDEAWLIHWLEKKSDDMPKSDVDIVRKRSVEVFGRTK